MVVVLVVVGFFVIGATLSWIAWAGSQRRLPPNGLLGLPTPAARSSERNWFAAHEAAAGPLGLGGGIALICGVGIATVGIDLIGQVLVGVGLVLSGLCIALALVSAQRAANAGPES